eukprot:scaffold405162_cov46-Prasinocladus_malaysianus.AAC.1
MAPCDPTGAKGVPGDGWRAGNLPGMERPQARAFFSLGGCCEASKTAHWHVLNGALKMEFSS